MLYQASSTGNKGEREIGPQMGSGECYEYRKICKKFFKNAKNIKQYIFRCVTPK